MTIEQRAKLIELARQGLSYRKISKEIGVSLRRTRIEFIAQGFEVKRRGLAVVDPKRRREIAAMGGQTTADKSNHMSQLGKLGGAIISSDKEHMSKIGTKGGKSVSKDRAHMSRIGKMGVKARRLKALK